MTNIPRVRSSVAIAFPIPDPPPVTRATLPLNRPLRKTDIVLEKKSFHAYVDVELFAKEILRYWLRMI